MISYGNGFILQDEKYGKDNAGSSLKNYVLLKKGEYAYNHGASKNKPYGVCYRLKEDDWARVPFVYHCFSISQDDNYWQYALNIRSVDRQLKLLVSSGARMNGLLNITFDAYSSITVYKPSNPEQKKISAFLDAIEERIQTQNKIIGDLTTLRRCFAESIFCEKNPDAKMVVLSKYLKESKEEKCNEPSKDKLLTVRLNFQGVCKNTNVESLKMSGTLYFLRKAGQFIYGKQNLHHGAFGIVPDELDGFCSSGDVPSLDIVGIDPFILLLAIQANCQKWERYATGTGSKRIHEKSFLQISVPIPDVKKHKDLTSFFTLLDEKIRLEESILNKLIDQKKYFLENLFV